VECDKLGVDVVRAEETGMVEPVVVVDVKRGRIDPTEFLGAGEPPNAPLEV
jgi:hypothetical protein